MWYTHTARPWYHAVLETTSQRNFNFHILSHPILILIHRIVASPNNLKPQPHTQKWPSVVSDTKTPAPYTTLDPDNTTNSIILQPKWSITLARLPIRPTWVLHHRRRCIKECLDVFLVETAATYSHVQVGIYSYGRMDMLTVGMSFQ